ncbi:MAG: hypothetical protein ABR985_21210 [Methanotrichaceae archaeon]|jgi:Mn-dependent DtxR family transcriptional regulator
MDEMYWKILETINLISGSSGIYIAPDKVREKIGIPEGKYFERINDLEKMGFLKIVVGGGAKLTLEGSIALQEKKKLEV